MRHLTWVAAITLAVFATSAGMFSGKHPIALAEPSSVVAVDVLQMQLNVGRDLPSMVIDNLV